VNEERLRTAARMIAIAGAAIVFGSLFLHWYQTKPWNFHHTVAQSGWISFHDTDIALTAIAAAAIVLAVVSFFVARRAVMAAIGVLGVAAVALTVRHMDSMPTAAVSIDFGAYLGLAGAAILAIAGVAGALAAGTKRAATATAPAWTNSSTE
jgi:hypothetical protein